MVMRLVVDRSGSLDNDRAERFGAADLAAWNWHCERREEGRVREAEASPGPFRFHGNHIRIRIPRLTLEAIRAHRPVRERQQDEDKPGRGPDFVHDFRASLSRLRIVDNQHRQDRQKNRQHQHGQSHDHLLIEACEGGGARERGRQPDLEHRAGQEERQQRRHPPLDVVEGERESDEAEEANEREETDCRVRLRRFLSHRRDLYAGELVLGYAPAHAWRAEPPSSSLERPPVDLHPVDRKVELLPHPRGIQLQVDP
mmetsp:Transcript_25822/g.61608  ORF Transcript_25822/g.61608 Transcript_25822/m.61608 type:complete len:256 (-) Transcript_25822:164-931(-)